MDFKAQFLHKVISLTKITQPPTTSRTLTFLVLRKLISKYQVDSGFTTADDFTETSVRIKSLGRRELGRYFCRAQNKLGSGEGVVEIVQSYQPNCIIGLCDSFSGASTTTVSWSSFTIILSSLLMAR